jgi:two-component system LytT family sensor kinase
VENALQHGVERRAGAGLVEITARRDAGSLVLSVRDDGPGTRGNGGRAPADGVGLSNTRHRLRQLYGDAQRLDLADGATGGFEATVVIPWRAASDGVAEPAPA